MRVAVLPTGRTEWYGLARALGRLFPGHTFYSLPTAAEVASNPDGFPLAGFTSVPLKDSHEQDPPEAARELVARAAQEALGDLRSAAADLVLIVDDVELPNMGQPARVVSVLRGAARAHLDGLRDTGHRAKTAAALRDKVSFHLAAPMIEGWFFADADALARAGVPSGANIQFAAATDPEAFATYDPAYLAATEADCPALAALSPQSKKTKQRPKWLGSLPRESHPKGYLQWLCREPAANSCTSYSESQSGARALAEISWSRLLGRPAAHFGLLRALVEDLEAGLGATSTAGGARGAASPWTAWTASASGKVLRNI